MGFHFPYISHFTAAVVPFFIPAVKGNARESEVNASSVKQKISWNWRSVAYEIQEIHDGAVKRRNPGNVAPSSNLFPDFGWLLHNGIQEQIAASHEFDGVRKEKEKLTAT